jgi:hypothetical protein
MASEKNDLTTSANSIKTKGVAVKRRLVEPKEELKEEPKKEAEVKPKKSKLAVRIVGREFKAKERLSSAKSSGDKSSFVPPSGTADAKDHFHRATHHIEEPKTEGEHHKKKKEKSETGARSVGVYRKISLFFIFLTIALLAAAFYFFLVSLTVEVTAKTERISDKLNITLTNGGSDQGGIDLSGKVTVAGSVEQIPVKEQKIYEATGANILGQEIRGKVSIINNYSQEKTLVATTRLLSPDGKLFRIKDKITIPAGGSVDVAIYTDEPSKEMAIGPSTFTIPGLWAGLQDKIYAKSKIAFVYQSNVQKFVQSSDIEKAMQDIKETLIKKVNDQFTGNYRGFDKVMVQVDKDSLMASSSVKANQKVDSFTLSLSALVNVTAFQTAVIEKLAKDRLISMMPAGEKFVGLASNETQYTLTSGDFKSGTANLDVSLAGSMVLSDINNAVDKTKLVGLTGSQIQQYLQGLNKFSDIKLIFTPPFIKKAPSLVDRIKIVIK